MNSNRNWDDSTDFNNGYGGYRGSNNNRTNMNRWDAGMTEDGNRGGGHSSDLATDDCGGHTQPLLLNFKQFMCRLDDDIDHEEAASRFDDYRCQFKQKQLSNFFNAHKSEQWFRHRYHPTESSVRRQQLRQHLLRRRRVFFECLQRGLFDKVNLDADRINDLLRTLDTIAIRLEGGDDRDLIVLDHELSSLDKLIKSTDANRNVKAEPEDINVQMDSDLNGNLDLKSLLERPLHKTTSLFLRQLPLELAREELEQLFEKHHFLRIALADPHFDDSGVTRKAWVSFARNADIKQIYLELNGVKVRGMEIGAIINKDLCRRIRSTHPLNSNRNAITAHIRLAVKLILHLDRTRKVWQHVSFNPIPNESEQEGPDSVEMKEEEDMIDETTSKALGPTGSNGLSVDSKPLEDDETLLNFELDQVEHDLKVFGLDSRNPVLKLATDYLIEVGAAEEEELLGGDVDLEADNDPNAFERDEAAIRVLDKLLLYLRTVHSFDFYYYGEYANEDEMPNRLGILHVRGKAPTLEQLASGNFGKAKLDSHLKLVDGKINSFIDAIGEVELEKAKELGLRDPEVEVEQFINDNTVEIAKEKWLCPLSGKKFKGADFVKKHILNKHAERLQQVREDCEFFNNYVKDKRRPLLPEHPTNRSEALKKLQQNGVTELAKSETGANDSQPATNVKTPNTSSHILNPRVR